MIDPNEALQQMLQPVGLPSTLFPPASRYHGIETATLETAEGKKVIYLKRRFVPPPERFELLQEHVVTQGERLDNITARYLGDPEQFWRLCDANGVLHPRELEEVGRRLRITLPEGIPGMPNA
jgi:hypothetical protein